jgi:trypsin-like peptidase
MPKFDDDLPAAEIDLRNFAPAIAAQPNAIDQLRSAMGGVLRSRAVVFGVDTVTPEGTDGAHRLIEVGVEAARKVAADPSVELSTDERLGYEAVVRLTERPALIIRDDSFPEPPPRWKVLDRPFRKEIETMIPSVGRIDANTDGVREMIGTGFVVSSDLVMTNTHVVEEFADPDPEFKSWSIRSGAEPTIDFKAEHEIPKRKAFRITSVVTAFDRGNSDRLKSLDLALLRIEPLSFDPPGAKPPPPLRLTRHQPLAAGNAQIPSGQKDLFLIGYPWTDNEGITPPAVLAEIFGGIVKMKRLQPGEYGANFDTFLTFSHDSATLGGNSGSFVADLNSGDVIGLHFKGKYKQANYALQLWKLADVPGVSGKGVNFSE